MELAEQRLSHEAFYGQSPSVEEDGKIRLGGTEGQSIALEGFC